MVVRSLMPTAVTHGFDQSKNSEACYRMSSNAGVHLDRHWDEVHGGGFRTTYGETSV